MFSEISVQCCQVGRRASQCYPEHVFFWVFEISRVYRYRLCPAEFDEEKGNSPYWVKVLERVKRQPAQAFSGGISQAIRYIPMGKLMYS